MRETVKNNCQLLEEGEFSLPKGRAVKKLGEVCEIRNGGTPKTGNKEYWNGGIKWITPKDLGKLNDIYVADTLRKISEIGLQKSSAKIIPKNSIILSTRAPIGYIAINTLEMATNQGCRGIIPSNKIIEKYLFYFLRNSVNLLNDLGVGTTFKELSTKALASVQIPVPSLPEQKRIVAILDRTFKAIDQAKTNTEQNLKNAKELFESYLQGVFSDRKWSIVKLDDVCEKVEYGSSSKSSDEGCMPVLRMGNIQNGRFMWDDLKYSNNEEDNEKYLLNYNDVLFNRTNSPELVGKTAIYKSEMPAIFAGYLIRIRRKKDLLNADYLNYYLNSQMAKNYGYTVVISSVNQANINGKKLKTYPIPLPPIEKQEQIVKELDSLSSEIIKLSNIYQSKLANIAELKKSILQKAFTGDL